MLKKIDYSTLIIFSIFLGLAPFVPEPHLWQKVKMLMAGTLSRPIDVFDMFFHGAGFILLILKVLTDKELRGKR